MKYLGCLKYKDRNTVDNIRAAKLLGVNPSHKYHFFIANNGKEYGVPVISEHGKDKTSALLFLIQSYGNEIFGVSND